MLPTQRYISNELTHFVGQNAPDPDAQYRLLRLILSSGELKAVHEPLHGTDTIAWITKNAHGSATAGDLVQTSNVCFCDIPVQDLGLHMNKYSHFGLSFLKPFLTPQGANPVHYISTATTVLAPDGHLVRRLDQMARFFTQIDLGRRHPKLFDHDPQLHKDFHDAVETLCTYILATFKPFDPATNDIDRDNTYMEREWRTNNAVTFDLDNVERVILPRTYATEFRRDFGSYTGQLTFAPEPPQNATKDPLP